MKRHLIPGHRARVAELLALNPERTNWSIGHEVGVSASFVADSRTQLGMKTTDELRVEHVELLLSQGKATYEIVKLAKTSPGRVVEIRKMRADRGLVDPTAASLKLKAMATMAADGYNSEQISEALGVEPERVRLRCRQEGIDVPGDIHAGQKRKVNGNRVMHHIVEDADDLTSDVKLIDFTTLDKNEVPGWLKMLRGSRRKLTQLIDRLQIYGGGNGNDQDQDAGAPESSRGGAA